VTRAPGALRARPGSTQAGLAFAALATLALLVGAAGCGGAPPPTSTPSASTPASTGAPAVAPKAASPEPFRASSGATDPSFRYVRPERSSRLDLPLPKGRASEAFRAPLEVALAPAFVLAAGNRVAAVGRIGYALFDDRGVAVDKGALDPAVADVHVDRGSGAVVASPDPRVDRLDGAAHAAVHGETVAVASPGSLRVIDRGGEVRSIIDGAFDALGLAIDAGGVAHALVRLDGELALWSAPLTVGSLGRQRLGKLRRSRAETPPVLGKELRVLVLDDRILALGNDGKKLWERPGAVTGGVSVTADDRLLVANDGVVLAIDPAGRASKVVDAGRATVFVTPPILTASGLLVVASGTALHGFAFDAR